MRKRIYWIDIIKIVACFMVLINHTGGYILEYNATVFGYNLYYTISFVFCKVGVPLFIMSTGYLLLKEEYNFKKVFKRINRIIIPLLVISIFLFFKDNPLKLNSIPKFIITFIKNPIFVSYWYLYMLVGLYMITPFVQKMIKNFKLIDFRNFCLICLIVPSLIYTIKACFNISISDMWISSIFPINIGYYVSGIYLSSIQLKPKYKNVSLLTFMLSIIIFFLIMFMPYLNKGNLSYYLDSYIYLPNVISSLSLFYIIRYYFENKNMDNRIGRVITLISSLTFGIYLTHTLIIYKVYNFSFMNSIFNINAYLGIIILEITVFTICAIGTYILKKIPFIKKFL